MLDFTSISYFAITELSTKLLDTFCCAEIAHWKAMGIANCGQRMVYIFDETQIPNHKKQNKTQLHC